MGTYRLILRKRVKPVRSSSDAWMPLKEFAERIFCDENRARIDIQNNVYDFAWYTRKAGARIGKYSIARRPAERFIFENFEGGEKERKAEIERSMISKIEKSL